MNSCRNDSCYCISFIWLNAVPGHLGEVGPYANPFVMCLSIHHPRDYRKMEVF